ncbi:beta-lactamase-like protein [Globomyces pollinis-pini]|nr:beta-lactamase-like protein [Globomyces pollinis-pini]
MDYSFQIISTHTVDSRPSIYFNFPSGRYLFNVGEGLQRKCNESKIKMSKINAILSSRMRWDCIGGLPGMILTCADAGVKQLNIIGPTNLTHFLAGTRAFVRRPKLDIKLTEIKNTSTICLQDENLTITAVSLYPEAHSLKRSLDSDDNGELKRSIVKTMFPDSTTLGESFKDNLFLPLTSTSDTFAAITYICQGPTVPGKMNAAEAKRLGVKNGKDMGRLVRGEEVVTEFGTTVKPEQCVSPEKPGAITIILDLPNEKYISSLLINSDINDCLNDSINPPKCIIHNVGKSVLDDPRYLEWVKTLPPSTQNYIISPEIHDEIPYKTSHDLILQLNDIDQNLFPTNGGNQVIQPFSDVISKIANFKIAKSMLEYQIEPTHCELPEPKVQPSSIYWPKESLPMIKELKNTLRNIEIVEDCRNVKLLPLGTASAIPGKYRNVSATVVELDGGIMLLDAGEGTLGQLYRTYGNDLCMEKLRSLKLIFISHLHADHHLGTINVLLKWNEITKNYPSTGPMFIIAPFPMHTWLKEFSEVQDFGFQRLIFLNSKDLHFSKSNSSLDVKLLYESLNCKSIQTVPVVHCNLSFAIVISQTNGFKISYSGDCRPSNNFITVGMDSDVLIHEATMDDTLCQEAVSKNHCTIAEAIDVGTRMNAKNVLLTHFSQRYPKFPKIVNEFPINNGGPVFGIAFDLMHIEISQFRKLPHLVKPLSELYSEEDLDCIEPMHQ